jgi:hypothetical protein
MKKTILAFAMSIAAAGGAWACSCRPFDRAEMIKDSAAAFNGRVLSVKSTGQDINDGELIARVRILKAYKGVRRGRIITLKTAPNGALCGIGMAKGDVVSVAAHRDRDGAYSTGLCMQLR